MNTAHHVEDAVVNQSREDEQDYKVEWGSILALTCSFADSLIRANVQEAVPKTTGDDDGLPDSQERQGHAQEGRGSIPVTAAVLGENVVFPKTLQKTVNEGVDDIVNQSQCYADNPLPSCAGHVAEADHCATFNTRKALERDSARAVREPNGTHGDYKIVKGDKVLREGEVKYHGSAEKTENAMRGYGDKQLVGPADQVEEIGEIARRKGSKGNASPKESRRQVGREHEAVEQNASDCITDGKTKSTPRTRKEARRLVRKAAKGKAGPQDVLPPLGESLKLATRSGAVSGAKLGALVGGVVSGASNLTEWANDEKSGEDAFVDTATDVTMAAIDGGVKGVVASGATALAAHVATKITSTAMKTALRSSAPAVVVIGAIEVGKDVVDLARGEMDGEEFCEKTAKTAATTACGWAGAEIVLLATSFVVTAPLSLPVTLGIGAIGSLLGAFGVECLWD